MPRGAAVVALAALGIAGATGCRRSHHAHITSYSAPPLQAGFVEHSGNGWRIAVPSTWRDATHAPAAWAASDPQSADDFHANVNVITEAYSGESYDYARASEVALRGEPRTSVDATREDIVDGDPTLVIESHWAPVGAATVPFHTMQSALSSRGAGYVVTCTVASSAFERYRSTCDSIVRSFAVER